MLTVKRGAFVCFLLAILAVQISAQQQTCTKCRCLANTCDPADPECKPIYRDTCDNRFDITSEDSCAQQCGCCIKSACYKTGTYSCIMYRSFEIWVTLYFLMIFINSFFLNRLKKKMFSPHEEKRIDGGEDERRETLELRKLLEEAPTNGFNLKFTGNYELLLVEQVFSETEEQLKYSLGLELFKEIKGLEPLAKKNKKTLLLLLSMYITLLLFHLVDIFGLWDLPSIFIFTIWLQNLVQLGLIAGLYHGLKKMTKYIDEVRKVVSVFELRKGMKITLKPREKRIEFIFLKSSTKLK